jgi:hypothetical protein
LGALLQSWLRLGISECETPVHAYGEVVSC